MPEMKTIWTISVRAGNQRKDIRLETIGEEKPQDTYRRVKEKAKVIELKVLGQATVDIISHSIPFKPKGVKPHKSWRWCPYCNKWRVFNFDDYLGVNRCSICTISDHDFFVRKYNNLWDKA